MINKRESQKAVMTDLFASTTKKDIEEKIIIEKKENEEINTIENSIEEKKDITTKKRTYNIPSDLLEKMDIIKYMDRDIKDNTDLLIKALRQYLDTKACKDLINEYNTLKGGKQ